MRVLVALSGVVLVTFVGYRVIPVNPTTVGFAYLLLMLTVAGTSGFLEAALSSLLATLLFNFLLANPNVPTESRQGQLTIADEEVEHLRELIDDAIEMARCGRPAKDSPVHAHNIGGRGLRSRRSQDRRRGAGEHTGTAAGSRCARHEHARNGRLGRMQGDS